MKESTPKQYDTTKVAWRKPDECCETVDGSMPPRVVLEIAVGADGSQIAVNMQASHKCGIKGWIIFITITREDRRWVWDSAALTEDAPTEHNQRFEFGTANGGSLPEERIDSIMVEASVQSECATFTLETDRVRILR